MLSFPFTALHVRWLGFIPSWPASLWIQDGTLSIMTVLFLAETGDSESNYAELFHLNVELSEILSRSVFRGTGEMWDAILLFPFLETPGIETASVREGW